MTIMTKSRTEGAEVGPFDAVLEKSPASGCWTYVIWPESPGFFGTQGR